MLQAQKVWVERTIIPSPCSRRLGCFGHVGYLLPQLFYHKSWFKAKPRIAEQGSFSTHQVYNEHEKGQKNTSPPRKPALVKEASMHKVILFFLLACTTS